VQRLGAADAQSVGYSESEHKMNGYRTRIVYFHIFPSLKLPSLLEKMGEVELKSRAAIHDEDSKSGRFLEYAFSVFKDPFGNNLPEGIYTISEGSSVGEDIWLLLRYAAFRPSEEEEIYRPHYCPDLTDWFAFCTSWHVGEKGNGFEVNSVARNGIDIWDVFSRTGFFSSIQRLHRFDQYLLIQSGELSISRRLFGLFSHGNEYDVETIKLAERLREAIYWYNASYEESFRGGQSRRLRFWNLESQILNMAIAFEVLFQPPKSDIQKHLETSLSVMFPDNEFVSKWLKQFYTARSAIAHGSTLEARELQFRPDRSGHRSLIYWARRIFRACVEATISQWETARKSGLLRSMTPNRIRLNRILGKLKTKTKENLIKEIPKDIRTDIRDLHASYMDIPGESYLKQTDEIGRILCAIAIESSTPVNVKLRDHCKEILTLPQDWYKVIESRKLACHSYASILETFGDEAKILDPPIQLDSANDLDQVLYHWAKFAYAHVWSVDM